MDCRTCQPSLIDLLHGELALEAAEQARAHIAHCANCRGALDKLAKGLQHAKQLPLEDPPQAVTARLLQLADEQARRAAAARKPRGAPTVWQALLDFVGRFAAARQVGMVTIMLLIVAVGLWSLPQLKHTPIAAGGTVVHPDESGEAAPSTGVEPAQPLDLKVDLRAGRIRSREEVSMAAEHAPAVAPAAPVAAAQPAESQAFAQRSGRSPRKAVDVGAVAARSAAAPSGGAATKGELRQARKPSAAAPAPFPRNGAGKSAQPSALDDAQSAGLAESAELARPVPERRAAERGAYDTMLDRSLAGPSPAPAAKKAEASSAAPGAAALAAARTTAASRGCSAALPEYERTVRVAPGSESAGEALIEMARCVRASDAERARALLARAVQNPYVARKAASLLAQLPKADAAKGKGAAPAAAESESPVSGSKD